MTSVMADVLRAPPIIVHSPARWTDAAQSLQPFFRRLARSRDVLFVEDAVFLDDVQRPRLSLATPDVNVYRAVPLFPGASRGRLTMVQEYIRLLLLELIRCRDVVSAAFETPVQWFCTPVPAPFMLGAFSELGVVYDCRFAGSARQPSSSTHRQSEQYLLTRSDVVITASRDDALDQQILRVTRQLTAAIAGRHTHQSAARVTRAMPESQPRISSISNG